MASIFRKALVVLCEEVGVVGGVYVQEDLLGYEAHILPVEAEGAFREALPPVSFEGGCDLGSDRLDLPYILGRRSALGFAGRRSG